MILITRRGSRILENCSGQCLPNFLHKGVTDAVLCREENSSAKRQKLKSSCIGAANSSEQGLIDNLGGFPVCGGRDLAGMEPMNFSSSPTEGGERFRVVKLVGVDVSKAITTTTVVTLAQHHEGRTITIAITMTATKVTCHHFVIHYFIVISLLPLSTTFISAAYQLFVFSARSVLSRS